MGTVNSNMAYSKFHLIQNFCHIIFSMLLSSYVWNALLIRISLISKENSADEWVRINRAQPVKLFVFVAKMGHSPWSVHQKPCNPPPKKKKQKKNKTTTKPTMTIQVSQTLHNTRMPILPTSLWLSQNEPKWTKIMKSSVIVEDPDSGRGL